MCADICAFVFAHNAFSPDASARANRHVALFTRLSRLSEHLIKEHLVEDGEGVEAKQLGTREWHTREAEVQFFSGKLARADGAGAFVRVLVDDYYRRVSVFIYPSAFLIK